MQEVRGLFELFGLFFKIGLFTFGGGYAMIPMLQLELAQKRSWITEDELLDYYAIGQSTPGVIAVNVATFVGIKRGGILGGIIATAGIVCPSLIIISIIAGLISSVNEFPLVQKALSGINVAVAALLTEVTLSFAKKTIKNPLCVLICAVSFVAVFFFKIQSFWVILVSGFLGIILAVVFPEKSLLEKKSQEQ